MQAVYKNLQIKLRNISVKYKNGHECLMLAFRKLGLVHTDTFWFDTNLVHWTFINTCLIKKSNRKWYLEGFSIISKCNWRQDKWCHSTGPILALSAPKSTIHHCLRPACRLSSGAGGEMLLCFMSLMLQRGAVKRRDGNWNAWTTELN